MAQKKNEQIEDILETFEPIEQRFRNESQETRIRMMLLTGNGKVIVGC